ncbi:IclR family transcriptional regulator [Streptomyces sp. NBC_01220]|uniref:IclR family transcriptional regulator n=1 Tax=Streptomyces poriferorum TaxID=2798799 RepID=A0ABY9IIF4_9ACTN|nr:MULTISPECIES: IclR family transcriptional regulator [Streptomyces]WSQ42343.1 IclR family transcriptional regulator [Streptomyces sp. NBC_01220]MBW5252583.1 IclR family transcriptional regulator [Streptomyces poriferorum]MBW5260619.1 IclR family transcriptional regulator [Streptomyces poriferorum]MDP5316697.1 IclR family transcriptional regulator [Streptomyces sp. Alt4]WLQ54996.1 IclR family transcriptional regulator [Streptomyces sp. Alt2]
MGRLVPAVTRALDVLELFLHGDGTLSAPEVTRKLQLPRTTVHELLTTLAARSYLVTIPDQPGRYRLGVRTYQLGSRYAEQLDLAAEGQQVARQVAETCGETVHVAILEGTDVIYIAKVDSTHAVRMVSAAGRKLPAHCTSVGKMLLAALPERELDARLEGLELTGMTPDSITDEAALREALASVRERGIAVEHRESNPDVSCVAAPVRDRSGRVVAALSVSVPMIRWTEEREAELAALAAEGAEALSGRLGHHRREK